MSFMTWWKEQNIFVSLTLLFFLNCKFCTKNLELLIDQFDWFALDGGKLHSCKVQGVGDFKKSNHKKDHLEKYILKIRFITTCWLPLKYLGVRDK
jgi:hypothetical protein